MNNKELIELFMQNPNKATGYIYKYYFPSIKRYVILNQGSIEDAKDLFQDVLLVLLTKLQHDNFILSASLKTYTIAIAKNLWLKRLKYMRMQANYEPSLDNQLLLDIESQIEQEKSYWEKLQDYFTKITKHCNELLTKIFIHGKTIEQIQDEYGYSSKHNAQNQQHKCLEQVRKVRAKEENTEKN